MLKAINRFFVFIIKEFNKPDEITLAMQDWLLRKKLRSFLVKLEVNRRQTESLLK